MSRGLLLLLLCSCWSTTFEAAGPPRRAAARGPVDVYLDWPPARPYAELGTIEVVPPGSSASDEEIVAHAIEKAREVGCDLIVARRRVARVAATGQSTGRPLTTAGVIQLGPVPGETIGGDERGSRRRRFVCGAWSAGAAPPGQ